MQGDYEKTAIKMRAVFLNTTILTAEGSFHLRKIKEKVAKQIIDLAEVQLSAVGHEATAKVMSSILGTEVPVNRIQYEQQVGDVALCFKLKTRLPEGKILNEEEVKALEYDLFMLLDDVTLTLLQEAFKEQK